MNSILSRMYRWSRAHKIISYVIFVVVVLGGYQVFWGGASAQSRYVLGTVQKQTLTVSVSGVGQVSASDQVDVKPKVSSDVTRVAVVAGQEVKAGQVLAYLNARDSSQSVQNARIALDNARITLQKLQQNQTVDAGTAHEDLTRAYDDALNSITSAYLSLPGIMTDSKSATYGGPLDGMDTPNASDYFSLVGADRLASFRTIVTQVKNDYRAANAAYEPAFTAYRALRRDATTAQILEMAATTERVVDLELQSLVSERNMFDTLVTYINAEALHQHVAVYVPPYVTNAQTVISGDIGSTNGISTALSTQTRAIQNATQTLGNTQLTDPLDLASQQNTVKQRQADLQNALIDLGDHTVRSPLSGTVAKVNVKKGDTASSGTAVATIISHQQIVNLSLNEVDVAKVKIGQKSTLTFDAISDLTMTGSVEQVDSIGTTSQGVVTYNVTIGLDTQDERVRPGMSVSTNVILDVHQDVLAVPIAAVKTLGDNSYVEVPDGAQLPDSAASIGVAMTKPPVRIPVTVGASDDTSTEILTGLTQGQTVVTRTIAGTTTSSTQTTQNRQGSIIPGVGGGGGNTRFIR